MLHHPSCFISYAREDFAHIEWVRRLAAALQRRGVMTHLDQWDIGPGDDLARYMETCIRSCDFVLMVCTPAYTRKANEGRGGVGYEKMVVTGEMLQLAANPHKFIPLLRKGEAADSIPSFLKSKLYVDFRTRSAREGGLEELLRHLYRVPRRRRPPLGSRPSFAGRPRSKSRGRTATDGQLARGLKRSGSAGVQSDSAFSRIVEHALDYKGLGLKTVKQARRFATRWLERYTFEQFSSFAVAYDFAYAREGMNRGRSGARSFAWLWTRKHRDLDFEAFKRAYLYARGSEGGSMPDQEAKTLAVCWLTRRGDTMLTEFASLYKLARSVGMDAGTATDFSARRITELRGRDLKLVLGTFEGLCRLSYRTQWSTKREFLQAFFDDWVPGTDDHRLSCLLEVYRFLYETPAFHLGSDSALGLARHWLLFCPEEDANAFKARCLRDGVGTQQSLSG